MRHNEIDSIKYSWHSDRDMRCYPSYHKEKQLLEFWTLNLNMLW